MLKLNHLWESISFPSLCFPLLPEEVVSVLPGVHLKEPSREALEYMEKVLLLVQWVS